MTEDRLPLAELLQSKREDLVARIIPIASLLTELPAVTLRGHESLARLKNGVEMGPADLATALQDEAPVVRVLGSDEPVQPHAAQGVAERLHKHVFAHDCAGFHLFAKAQA